MVIKIAAPSKRDIGTSLAGLVGPAMKPQTLFVFQEMLFCRCFEWMEPPLPSIPNLENASQIFGLSTRGVLSRTSCSSDHGNLCGSIPRNNDFSLFNLADGVGFEPTNAFTSAVFKTAALGRSATRPLGFGTWLPLGGIEPLSPLASRGSTSLHVAFIGRLLATILEARGSFSGLTSLLGLFRGFSVSLLRLHTARLVSSVRFQLSAGRCRAVFAFPVRRENSVSNGKNFVNLFFVKWQIIFKRKKAPSVKQRGR